MTSHNLTIVGFATFINKDADGNGVTQTNSEVKGETKYDMNDSGRCE